MKDIEKQLVGIDEKIAKTERMLERLEAKEKRLKQKEKKLKGSASREARNARTKRLIELGAIMEKAIEIEIDTDEKRERLFAFITDKRYKSGDAYISLAEFIRRGMQ